MSDSAVAVALDALRRELATEMKGLRDLMERDRSDTKDSLRRAHERLDVLEADRHQMRGAIKTAGWLSGGVGALVMWALQHFTGWSK